MGKFGKRIIAATAIFGIIYLIIINALGKPEQGTLDYALVNLEKPVIAFALILLYLIVIFAIAYNDKTKKNLFYELIRSDTPKKGLFELIHEMIHPEESPEFQEKMEEKRNQIDRHQLTEVSSYALHGTVLGENPQTGRIAILPETHESSLIVAGSSGTGKSVTLIPTIRYFRGRLLVVDISGDLSKHAISYRQNAKIINPLNISCHYDILANIRSALNRGDMTEFKEQITILSHAIVKMDPNDRNGGWFTSRARKVMRACLIAYIKQGKEFTDICDIIMTHSAEDLFADIWDTGDEDAQKMINGFSGLNENNAATIKDNLDAAIEVYSTNEHMRDLLNTSVGKVFRPQDIENCDVFLQVPEEKLTVYGPTLLNIIIEQMIQYLSTRPTVDTNAGKSLPKVNLIIDEATRIGRINSILDAVRTLRKRQAVITLCTQSPTSDLRLIYGDREAGVIMENTEKLILGVASTESQKMISELIGERDKTYINRSWRQTDIASYNTTTQRRNIIDPASLGFVDDNLIYIGRKGYILLKKYKYYEYDDLNNKIF